MKYDPAKHHRRSIRLKGYDYAQPGAYFVTICVQNRECALGEVVDGEVRLNEWGQAVEAEWQALPGRFPYVELDAFVVMPNHVHGIMMMVDGDRGGAVAAPTNEGGETLPLREPLGKMVAYFKYQTTKRLNAHRATPGAKFWQRNYYEHVIRNDVDLKRIREYIHHNPARWAEDQLHPAALPNRFNRD